MTSTTSTVTRIRNTGEDADLHSAGTSTLRECLLQLQTVDPNDRPYNELCDLALVMAYAYKLNICDSGLEALSVFLESASDRIAQIERPYCGLFGGLAGAGWAIQHVAEILDQGDSPPDQQEDPLNDVDLAIWREINCHRWTGPYDLIGGLVGFGVYFLERFPRPVARQGLTRIWHHLSDLSKRSGGPPWHTAPNLLPEWQRQSCPNGYYNLGVAHGIPGVAAFLAELILHDIEPTEVHPVLERTMNWLRDQLRPANEVSRFPSWVVPGMAPAGSRMGWCYGGVGIAAIFHNIGLRLQRPDWRNFGLQILHDCIRWGPEEGNIVDAGICHGAFGIGHIYNRAYRTERFPYLLQASSFWYRYGLSLARPDLGLGGFPSFRIEPTRELVPDCSFLAGSSGAALCLMSALYDIEPQWDRVLLLSGR